PMIGIDIKIGIPVTFFVVCSVINPPIAIVSPSRRRTVVSALRVLICGGAPENAAGALFGLLTSGFTFSVIRRSAFTVGRTVNFTPASTKETLLEAIPWETVETW